MALRSSRWTFSMSAISSASPSDSVRIDDRHVVQAGPLRGAPAPLAGDDLVAIGASDRPHHQRLDDARSRIESASSASSSSANAARIARIGAQQSIGTLPARSAPARGLVGADVADQRGQAASQPCPGAAPACRHAIVSPARAIVLGSNCRHAARQLRSRRMHFRGEPEIGLAAGALVVIEQRPACRRTAPPTPGHCAG